MPSGVEPLTQRVTLEEADEGILVAPLGEDRQPSQLESLGRDDGRPESHEGEALEVVEAGDGHRGGRPHERCRADPGGHLRQVEAVDHAAGSSL